MSNIGTHLKELRIKNGLSLDDVYKTTGIADSTLSKIENGKSKRPISVETLLKLASAYKINFIDLLVSSSIISASDVATYQKTFKNTDYLNTEELAYIQKMINYIVGSHNTTKGD